MKDRLAVIVLGHRSSGKSTTWYHLFGDKVRTGKNERPMYLNSAQWVDIFLVSGSAEERGKEVSDILPEDPPKIVLCSAQYKEGVMATFDHFFSNGYDVFVQWLNPGYEDEARYQDDLGLVPKLMQKGATVQQRNGKENPPTSRVRDIREHILGWASYRNLVKTDFPA